MYTIVYNLHCKNVHLSRWIIYVSSIFQNSGGNYVWLTQDCNIDYNIIFKSECDQFMQLWHSRIINRDNDHNVTYSFLNYHMENKCIPKFSRNIKKGTISIQNRNIHIILLFGRSRMIVGHHRFTDELFPAAAIFGSPYAM